MKKIYAPWRNEDAPKEVHTGPRYRETRVVMMLEGISSLVQIRGGANFK